MKVHQGTTGLQDYLEATAKFLRLNDVDPTIWHQMNFWIKDNRGHIWCDGLTVTKAPESK